MSTNGSLSIVRIYAMVLRHVYLLRKSWVRIFELAYYPSVSMVLWGFITQYMAPTNPLVIQAPGLFLAAVLLWDTLFRAQLGVSLTFFEELYSRNLGHLFVSPLRPYELILSVITVSLLRTSVGIGGAALLAIVLFKYSIFGLGLPLLAFYTNLLVMGWAIGLMVSALVLRWGLGAENLAWALIFVLAPFSGVYYPVSVLPQWVQPLARALPSTQVFEGMRAVMLQHVFRHDLFFNAVALNGLYLAVGAVIFLIAFRAARMKGLLLQIGE